MASLDECQAAVGSVIAMLDDLAPELREQASLERTVSCRVTDLNVVFFGHLRDGRIHDLQISDAQRAQVRIAVNSDDLLLLVAGQLDIGSAWARGRLKVDASVLDLLRLRALI